MTFESAQDENNDGTNTGFEHGYAFISPLTKEGEWEHYSSRNPIFEGEPEEMTAYNVATLKGKHFFKSNGFLAMQEPENPASVNIDFLPANTTNPSEVDRNFALASFYRGIENFFHALENEEFPATETLSGKATNLMIAKLIVGFGMRVFEKVGETEELNELSKDEIQERIKEVEQGGSFDGDAGLVVKGNVASVREHLSRMKEKGIAERIMRNFITKEE